MVKQATFITSAAGKKGWIMDNMPEVCFLGRSNVGKSTFINAMTNQKKLAKTSSTPGKTRLLNFFEINLGEFRIVDAPGYGFAKVSGQMKLEFADMMEDFLQTRSNLRFVCQLVDLRHKPTNDDKDMYQYCKHIGLPVLLVATKKDKVKRNDIKKNEKLIIETLNKDPKDPLISMSSTSKEGLEEVYNKLVEMFNKYTKPRGVQQDEIN